MKTEFILTKNDCLKEHIIPYGNMFLIGNGHIGYRGTLEEYQHDQLTGLNVIGFYDQYLSKWRESLNLLNPFFFKEKTNNCLDQVPLKHEIKLDIYQAIFSRFSEFNDVIITSKRIIHQEIDNLLMCEYHLKAKHDATINLTFGLDEDIYEINGPHYQNKIIHINDNYTYFEGLTNENKHVYMDYFYHIDNTFNLNKSIINNLFNLQGDLKANQEIIIKVFCKIHEHTYDINAKQQLLEYLNKNSFDDLFNASLDSFKKKWLVSDVILKGDEKAQFALRYSIYQLLILGNERYTHSIPARGLSGQVYKGAIFWDTEMFIYPFFNLTAPKIAKKLLQYRINTLNGALLKAKEYGFDGAFFAWESQDDGKEACSKYNVTDPVTKEPIRTYFNEKQIHLSGDIVYAFDDYISKNSDYDFLNEGAFTLIQEVARFICLYSKMKEDNLYHLDDVIGPDEYHERVDDNAYTTYISYNALKVYLKYQEYVLNHQEFKDLPFDKELFNKVNEVYRNYYLPQVNENDLIEQFKGYFALEDVSVEEVKSRLKYKNEYWGGPKGVATKTRVIKQADVIALICAFKEQYSMDIIKKNYDFYAKYTEHGSSLSSSMYSQCACLIGYEEEAYKMFMKSASIDLSFDQKNFAGGIYIGGTHPASNGGSYLSVVHGFLGMRYENGKYNFYPRLPKKIKEITLSYYEHGKLKIGCISNQSIEIKEVKQ